MTALEHQDLAIKREAVSLRDNLICDHEGDVSAALHMACTLTMLWMREADKRATVDVLTGNTGR